MKCPYCSYELKGEGIKIGDTCPGCGRSFDTQELVDYIMKDSFDVASIPVVTLDYLPGFDIEKVLGPTRARANAVLKVDFETSTIGPIMIFSAYGTAVIAKPVDKKQS